MRPVRVLGIESSCDETAAAVVEDGRRVRSSVVFSQEKIHGAFKGIVPEIASRAHLENINWVIEKALKNCVRPAERSSRSRHNAHDPRRSFDAIAVTIGPGLVGSLLVGKMTAQALGWAWNKPIVGINHLEAHLFSNLLERGEVRFPFLGLIVSGGHTDLVYVQDFGNYRVLGRTRDDAAGESFDKVAKLLDLGYPGGPAIEKLARTGNPGAVAFPRAYMPDTWDFSFSGIKTSVLYYLQRLGFRPGARLKADICASFQESVIDVLVRKTFRAAKKFGIERIVIGGGVSANGPLRERFLRVGRKNKMKVHLSSREMCTDNAAMVAALGYYKLRNAKRRRHANGFPLQVDASLPISNW